MSNIYQKLGLQKIVNANGRMTYLGVSTLSQNVINTFAEAAQNYVVVDDLLEVIGQKISQYTTAEDTCVTSSASAGIAIAVASTIAKDNLALIEQLPNIVQNHHHKLKNKVILPRGHAINYGAPISTMIGLGGGEVVEVGQANLVKAEHISSAIDEKTSAIMCVQSHHCVQKGMPSIPEMVKIAQQYKLPLILDAAAEEDLQKYVKMGVDLVIYSGAKALCGPTSGFITGKKYLVSLCKLQYKGIGRAMKVSKETTVALLQAIEDYMSHDASIEITKQKNLLNEIQKELQTLKYLTTSIEQDDAGREIYRLAIKVSNEAIKNAVQISKELKDGAVSIHFRDYYSNLNILHIDPRGLIQGDKELIVQKLKQIMQ